MAVLKTRLLFVTMCKPSNNTFTLMGRDLTVLRTDSTAPRWAITPACRRVTHKKNQILFTLSSAVPRPYNLSPPISFGTKLKEIRKAVDINRSKKQRIYIYIYTYRLVHNNRLPCICFSIE